MIINKAIAATVTICFLAAVRPNPKPSLAETAFVAILMYEGIALSIGIMQKIQENEKHKNRRKAYEKWLHQDGRRWADELLGKEVS